MDEIALEQIEAYTYNSDLQKNHVSILQNGQTIYFFRRINSSKFPEQKCLQLYKYDLVAKDKRLSKIPEICFEEKPLTVELESCFE